jgi:Protein of unknown function (DUF3574)
MLSTPKLINQILLVSLLAIAPLSYPRIVVAKQPETATVNPRAKTLIKDELYFGLNKPNGTQISETEWQKFLNQVITPRFKKGLTVLDTQGQYLSNNGELVKEKSRVVILIYEMNAETNRAIDDIINQYKRRFDQESVMRITNEVKVSF